MPYRVTECNSIWGGGKAGASDVFASALWALDFMWTVAQNNGQGINFHDGDDLIYSPIRMSAGQVMVHPIYYAMLAFKYANNHGVIIPTNIVDKKTNCSSFACANADGSYAVTRINREESKNATFNLQLNKPAFEIKIARLTAPSITATLYVTFAGNTVNADGTFTPATTENKVVSGKSFEVNVPMSSAAVVTIR